MAMDYSTWRILNAQDPKGRLALEKFIEGASEEEIEKLKAIVQNTPEALTHLARAIRTLELVLRDRGLL